MDRDALLLYLRDLRDLEFAKRKIEIIFNDEKQIFDRKISDLNRSNFTQIPDKKSGWSVGRTLGIIIFGVLSVSCLYFILFGTLTEKEYFPDSRAFTGQGVKYVSVPIRETNAVLILIAGLVICVVALWYIWRTAVRETRENKESIVRAEQNNEEELLRAKKNQEICNQTYLQWEKRLDYLTKEYKKVNLLLDANYSLNILANQYRNLASVYYIYDYMSSSRETLKDTLIHEHMENGIQRIIAKLNTIIQQQQEIIFHTRILEADNKMIIEQNEKMLKSLSRIEEDANIAVQYAEISTNYNKANAYFSLANYLRG